MQISASTNLPLRGRWRWEGRHARILCRDGPSPRHVMIPIVAPTCSHVNCSHRMQPHPNSCLRNSWTKKLEYTFVYWGFAVLCSNHVPLFREHGSTTSDGEVSLFNMITIRLLIIRSSARVDCSTCRPFCENIKPELHDKLGIRTVRPRQMRIHVRRCR
jgi:hypothetical protein